MIARLRTWWERRHDKPAPDPAFADRMRHEAAAALHKRREVIHRDIQRKAECPLVHDVFPRDARNRRQTP